MTYGLVSRTADRNVAKYRIFEHPTIAQFWNPLTAAGRAALDAVVTKRAQIIAYIDDYKLLMIATVRRERRKCGRCRMFRDT